MAPIDQTFASQPLGIPPMQVIGTPQYFPLPVGTTLPANSYYPSQPAIISSAPIVETMPWNSIGPITSPIVESENSSGEMNGGSDNEDPGQVQEGKIEGKIILPEDDSPASEMSPEES